MIISHFNGLEQFVLRKQVLLSFIVFITSSKAQFYVTLYIKLKNRNFFQYRYFYKGIGILLYLTIVIESQIL